MAFTDPSNTKNLGRSLMRWLPFFPHNEVLQVYVGLIEFFPDSKTSEVEADVMCFIVGGYFDIYCGLGGHGVFHCVHVVPPQEKGIANFVIRRKED